MNDIFNGLPIKVRINPSYEWDEESKELGVSHRELEVLALMVEGFKNKEIAEILHIKQQSVKNHFHMLTKKLSVKNSGEAMTVAIFRKMITIDNMMFPNEKPWLDSKKYTEFFRRVINLGDPNIDEKERRAGKVFLLSHGIDVNKLDESEKE